MRCSGFAVAVLTIVAFHQPASGGIMQWSSASGGNGHWYEFVSSPLDWPSAKQAAEASSWLGLGGHLVTITSAEENSFVMSQVLPAGQEFAWIGLTDSEQYSGHESYGLPNPQVDGWVWVTGEPVVYTNWNNAAQPDNLNNEDFAIIDLHAHGGETGWNDGQWNWTSAYIVEYQAVPEPSSIVVWSSLGAVGLVMLWRRRRAKSAA